MQTRTAQILVSLLFLTTAISSCDKKEVSPWNQMTEVNNQIVPPVFPEGSFVITDYHDVKDTLYTNAINRAITICSEQGGGKVIIPDGEFLTAPIRLKSNVNLHLSDSTVLKFTTDPFFFDLVQTRIEGIDCYNISPLIYAYGETNIAITGNGVMDGQADSSNWLSENRIRGIVQEDGKKINEKTLLYEMKEDSIPFKERVFMRENGIRPSLSTSINVRIFYWKDLLSTVLRSGLFIRCCPRISLSGKSKCRVMAIIMMVCDPESCRNVLIEDCDFDTGDDCIAIKSGRDEDGRYWNIPSENIIVRHCRMKDGHAGVAIGSEVTGGCRNVWVENCTMDSPELDRIIRIKSNAMRGGEVENIFIRNIRVGECKESILGFELKYWHVDDGPYLPYFHNIHLENITSKKSQYVLHLDGFEDKIQARDIFVKDCTFDGVMKPEINKVTGVENIHFENVTVNGQDFKGV